MVFSPSAPESFLARSDSKNPATTCKGVTSAGRTCRRALAASTLSASTFHRHDREGVLAILDAGNAAAFFCWQHKDQAESLVTSLQDRSAILPLKKKSSVDTLVERLGVLDIDESQTHSSYGNYSQSQSHAGSSNRRRDGLPQQWQKIQGPLLIVPEEIMETEGKAAKPSSRPRPRPPKQTAPRVGRSNVKASWSCCIRLDADDDPPPSRRRPTHDAHKHPFQSPAQPIQVNPEGHVHQISQQTATVARKPVAATPTPQRQQPRPAVEARGPDDLAPASVVTPIRPQLRPQHSSTSPPNSLTMTLLSYIPPHLTPAITSALLAELSLPISGADLDGYIYIYWLTPESDSSKPDDETASSLLDEDDSPVPSPIATGARGRVSVTNGYDVQSRTSQALQRYASVRRGPREPRKIMLKIGRTSNVHRRMTEWSKQCGQNITVIRCYPYASAQQSSPSLYPSIGSKSKTVRNVRRVERLIHLELAEKRATDKDGCGTCGRVHREWFEVEATKQGVREVDEVIRRWVDWAERHS